MKKTMTTKKNTIKKAIAIAATAILTLSSCISPCFAAANKQVIAKPTLQQKISAFVNDSRWSNGRAWGKNAKPIISPYNCGQCCAYTADFVKYVYNYNNPKAGQKFTNINEIRAGDVIYISPEHWFAVTARNGNVLTCCEGNYSGKVRVGAKRTIDATNKRFLDGEKNRSFVCGYHYTDKTDYSSPATPGKVSGLKATKTTKNSCSLSWKKAPGANQYEILDNGKVIARTTACNITIYNLKPNSVHTFQIKATYNYYGGWDYKNHTLVGQSSTALVVVTKKK